MQVESWIKPHRLRIWSLRLWRIQSDPLLNLRNPSFQISARSLWYCNEAFVTISECDHTYTHTCHSHWKSASVFPFCWSSLVKTENKYGKSKNMSLCLIQLPLPENTRDSGDIIQLIFKICTKWKESGSQATLWHKKYLPVHVDEKTNVNSEGDSKYSVSNWAERRNFRPTSLKEN